MVDALAFFERAARHVGGDLVDLFAVGVGEVATLLRSESGPSRVIASEDVVPAVSRSPVLGSVA